MDARSLAAELAPLLIWREGDSKADSQGHLSYTSSGSSKTADLVESPTTPETLNAGMTLLDGSGESSRSRPTFSLFSPSSSTVHLLERISEAVMNNGFRISDEGGTGTSTLIPLDDAAGPDYDAIEAVQCLIEHHNAVFTDANETIWK